MLVVVVMMMVVMVMERADLKWNQPKRRTKNKNWRKLEEWEFSNIRKLEPTKSIQMSSSSRPTYQSDEKGLNELTTFPRLYIGKGKLNIFDLI